MKLSIIEPGNLKTKADSWLLWTVNNDLFWCSWVCQSGLFVCILFSLQNTEELEKEHALLKKKVEVMEWSVLFSNPSFIWLLDSLFFRPGWAPVGGEETGEFRDWTKIGTKQASNKGHGRSQVSIENSSRLLWFWCSPLCDWLIKLVPLSPPMKSKTKTNRGLHTRIFPHLPASLVTGQSIWFCFCDTQLKPTIAVSWHTSYDNKLFSQLKNWACEQTCDILRSTM